MYSPAFEELLNISREKMEEYNRKNNQENNMENKELNYSDIETFAKDVLITLSEKIFIANMTAGKGAATAYECYSKAFIFLNDLYGIVNNGDQFIQGNSNGK